MRGGFQMGVGRVVGDSGGGEGRALEGLGGCCIGEGTSGKVVIVKIEII